MRSPLLLALVAVACAYQVGAWLLVRRFRADEAGSGSPDGPWPPVLQVKPVHGVERETRSCLRSFLDQDYPGDHAALVVADGPDDPALALGEELRRGLPGVEVRAVPGAGGSNRKIACVSQAVGRDEPRFVVLSDADIRVPRDHLRRVMAPFRDPEVGMVTSLYAVRSADGLGAALEALSVADFAASVLVARRVEGISFGLGATMAFRPQALEAIGGLGAVRDYLADDYQLGHRVARAGWKVVLSQGVAEDVLGPTRFADYFTHQLRWMRTYRVSRPAGHAAFLVTQGLPWGLLHCALGGPAWPLAAWLAVRLLTARGVAQLLAPGARWWPLAPVKDLFYLGLWLLSLGGSRVRWGDSVYRLRPDGTMAVEDPLGRTSD